MREKIKAKNEVKRRLGDVIQEQRRVPMGELSEMIQVADPTLRTWINKNTFPQRIILDLANAIGLKETTIEDIENAYEVKWSADRMPRQYHSTSSSLHSPIEFKYGKLFVLNGQKYALNERGREAARKLLNDEVFDPTSKGWVAVSKEEAEDRRFNKKEVLKRIFCMSNLQTIEMVGSLITMLSSTATDKHLPEITLDLHNVYTKGVGRGSDVPSLSLTVYVDEESLNIARQKTQQVQKR